MFITKAVSLLEAAFLVIKHIKFMNSPAVKIPLKWSQQLITIYIYQR